MTHPAPNSGAIESGAPNGRGGRGRGPRIVCWFSAGAPSAVATKLTISQNPGRDIIVARNVIPSEHPDNERYAAECEAWFGLPVTPVSSARYADTWDVWEKRRFLSGPRGALCTTELKKMPRQDFQRPDDVHVFGYTADKNDQRRAEQMRAQNFELTISTPLIDAGLTRADCLGMLANAGIKRPVMYNLGYSNNNCIPCVKASAPSYWNRIRRTHPERFNRLAVLSRELGSRLVRVNNVRIFLDELDPTLGIGDRDPEVSCSLLCAIAEESL